MAKMRLELFSSDIICQFERFNPFYYSTPFTIPELPLLLANRLIKCSGISLKHTAHCVETSGACLLAIPNGFVAFKIRENNMLIMFSYAVLPSDARVEMNNII